MIDFEILKFKVNIASYLELKIVHSTFGDMVAVNWEILTIMQELHMEVLMGTQNTK